MLRSQEISCCWSPRLKIGIGADHKFTQGKILCCLDLRSRNQTTFTNPSTIYLPAITNPSPICFPFQCLLYLYSFVEIKFLAHFQLETIIILFLMFYMLCNQAPKPWIRSPPNLATQIIQVLQGSLRPVALGQEIKPYRSLSMVYALM